MSEQSSAQHPACQPHSNDNVRAIECTAPSVAAPSSTRPLWITRSVGSATGNEQSHNRLNENPIAVYLVTKLGANLRLCAFGSSLGPAVPACCCGKCLLHRHAQGCITNLASAAARKQHAVCEPKAPRHTAHQRYLNAGSTVIVPAHVLKELEGLYQRYLNAGSTVIVPAHALKELEGLYQRHLNAGSTVIAPAHVLKELEGLGGGALAPRGRLERLPARLDLCPGLVAHVRFTCTFRHLGGRGRHAHRKSDTFLAFEKHLHRWRQGAAGPRCNLPTQPGSQGKPQESGART